MDRRYRAYDWTLASDCELPGLQELPEEGEMPDVRATLGPLPSWAVHLFDAVGEPWGPLRALPPELSAGLHVTTHQGGAYFRFRYETGVEFLIDRTGTGIWARWSPPFTSDDAALYLLGPVLGFVLRLRGRTCLHASAAVIEGRAIALVGTSGAGKSTTAAALTRRGYPLLADDVVVLSECDGVYRGLSGHPRQRLCPDAVEHLDGSTAEHRPLTPHWDKLAVELEPAGGRYWGGEAPLLVAYLLQPGGDDIEAPRIERLAPSHAVPILAAHTYRSELLDARMRAEEFQLLAGFVSCVPVCTLSYRRDLGSLDRLLDALLDDAGARARAAPGTSDVDS